MLTRQQKAEKLRANLLPFIESNGVEQEVECGDGTIRRYREARLGGFVLCYETPSHRNPRPIAACWDEALYLQANPIEDYALTIRFCDRPDEPTKGKRTTMFSACWRGKGDTLHISSFASEESRWYDILLAFVELATKAAQSDTARPSSPDASGHADTAKTAWPRH